VMTTRHQVGYWKDSLTVWSHTLQVTPPNFVAEDNLGAELINEGNMPAAREHFQAAVEINPQDPFSQLDIGVCDKKMGNLQGALEHYTAVLRLSTEPNLRSAAFSNLGSLYRMSGNYQAARENYTEALRIKQDNPIALIGLGLIAQKTGDPAGAVAYYSRGLAAEPSDVGYVLLARALETQGRQSESREAMERARKVAIDFEMAQKEATRLLSK